MRATGRTALAVAAQLLAVVVAGFVASAVVDRGRAMNIPDSPNHFATDNASLISTSQLASLNAKLDAYQNTSHHQLFVATFPHAPAESYDVWCPAVHNAWGAGRAVEKDGIVLFVFPEMVWITVGDGLESTLSDSEASELADAIAVGLGLTPNQTQAYAALDSGVDSIIEALSD